MKNKKRDSKIHLSFLVMISINLFFLRKFVYLDGYMDDCKKFNETTLPKKEEFYSHLNMEDITYMREKFIKTLK